MTAPSASARTCSSTDSGSDASSAHATVPPPRHARTARAAAVRSPSASGLERDDGERRAVRRVGHRDRVGVRQRALRGTQLRRPRSGCGDEVGADAERVARSYLDVHRVTTTVDRSFARIPTTCTLIRRHL